MTPKMRRRGQPMLALGVVLTSWVTARAFVWEMPSLPLPPEVSTARIAPPFLPERAGAPAPSIARVTRAEVTPRHYVLSPPHLARPLPFMHTPSAGPVFLAVERAEIVPASAATAPSPLPYVSGEAHPRGRRWSADAWMMLRDGGVSAPVTGPARATYGASQVGAVLRYRLVPDSGHRPTAYLRASVALVRPRDKEAATGLSIRPMPGLPLTVAAEMRVGDVGSDVRVRPAVMAVTELPPQGLALDLRAEAYAQAGYVGGKGASAFVDGQLRVDRRVVRMGDAELRAGGGTWGGVQEGASRLDLGPTATLAVPAGDVVFLRLAIDWRFRVAGNAVPESGPALTLSAGF